MYLDYDPYGAATVLNPDWSVRGTSSYGWMYQFQGKRYDNTVGLYDSRERVYSPTLMRPLQADPLGLGPDNNPYRWEGNGPADTVAPIGLCPPYDENGKRILPQYTIRKGYGFDQYGDYSYYDPLLRKRVFPTVVCHERNGQGRLPGLTSTDSLVNGRWHNSGSN